MAFASISKPSLHFNTNTFTGNNSTQTFTGFNFKPDMTWLKKRNGTANHHIVDAVRGVGYYLYPNLNNVQGGSGNSLLTAFTSDGYTVDAGADSNGSGATGVGWSWKANGAGSANTDGDINSTVSVNQTAGFSIVKYTGTDVAGATVGHGLNAVPKMIILKRLVDSGYDWVVYHKDKTAGLYLNSTGSNNDSSSNNIWFNGTAPTSSVFSIGTDGRIGDATDFIAYCFSEKTGYQKAGSYTGNGSTDGTFVYTGFKPAWIMVKNTGVSCNWVMFDNKRSGFNVDNDEMSPNTNGGDNDGQTYQYVDLLSNGFKWREASNNKNTSGDNFIYIAFGQSLVGSNNVPCTAR